MNLILMQKGFPPAIVKNTERDIYLQALGEADQGDLKPFLEFMANSLIETESMMVNELKKYIEKAKHVSQ